VQVKRADSEADGHMAERSIEQTVRWEREIDRKIERKKKEEDEE
jgi:hypothetical protein